MGITCVKQSQVLAGESAPPYMLVLVVFFSSSSPVTIVFFYEPRVSFVSCAPVDSIDCVTVDPLQKVNGFPSS
jgi:hypothetical protein